MEPLAVPNPFPGAACFLVRETDSTMLEALSLARLGLPPGSLVAADFQRSGRGRLGGRRWESEPGANLLCTIRLAPEAAALPALPLRIGAVLCATATLYAIRSNAVLRCPPSLKWPNDLLFRGRKAAGTVCESKPAGEEAGLYVGIGVNCNQTAFPTSIAAASTSLAAELGVPIDRWLFLELFLDLLAGELARHSWKKAVEDRLWMRGERVRFLPGLGAAGEVRLSATEGAVTGLLEGVDDEGSLLIRMPGEAGLRAFASGELTAAPELS
ncbi:MAG TPA: biotin--[acetyl-CoA-carboxylase] ligase [Rectinemataceae bacterium]|nr:biotin--[acetyl-CoA-carboxylase] ligase [Rectinemataceae bacterium]